jgi:UDP-glucose:(heptosyl)LPS alpha-1,3-glucosyltransferase
MKKLAFVINVFREDDFHSGGERVFYELVNRAVENKWVVDLYCTSYLSENNILKPKINNIIFLGHPKNFKYPEKIENFYNEVKKLTDLQHYDAVISENISPVIDIGILQGHSLLHYSKIAGNFLEKIWFSLHKFSFINAQKKWLKTQYRKVIVPSIILKDELKKNFSIPDEKFVVIYPCVDAVDTDIQRNNKDLFTFGLSAPSFSKKGGKVFLKALYLLRKQGYNFRAKIIYPKFAKNLELNILLKLYGLKEFVEFLPHQKDMKKFYNSVDFVVMPSVVETFGLVALEAMSYAKPAIVSSFSGASEILGEHRAMLVFDMNNKPEKNLAEKMKYFMENPDMYAEFSEYARSTAQKYNWQDFCNRFYEQL